MKKQMVSSPSRDSAIIARFNAMTDMEIEQRFRTAGGLFAENCFSERPLGSVVSERPDRWILETRAAPGGGNNVWIKSTCKIISDQERIWVLDWLKSLGFDEAEAIVYFSGNTPRKRDIAKQVGTLLQNMRADPTTLPDNGTPAVRAVKQLNSHIDSLVDALRTSGRVRVAA